jgi:hypothetical protein
MKIIDIKIPDLTYPHRHYCFSLEDALIQHKDPIMEKGIGRGWMKLVYNNNELDLDQKDLGKIGYKTLPIMSSNNNMTYDEIINEELFLLYDAAGLNYAHFFFDLFGKVLYYDELIKSNPNIVLGIPEDYYQTGGISNFIKQWLDLYYEGKDIKIIVLKKDIKYLVSKLIIPNILYGFPEGNGDNYIIDKIIETVSKIPSKTPIKNGCYISRQDTIKRGWYHKRDLINELEFIDKLKTELDYDIIELMDYDLKGKIQIYKSYKNIIQQSSASNINILFSNKDNNNIILTNPRMGDWLNYKLSQFSDKSKANLIILNGVGSYLTEELDPNQIDKGNYPWELHNIDGIIEVLKQINKGEI